jgi:hypothetical protein
MNEMSSARVLAPESLSWQPAARSSRTGLTGDLMSKNRKCQRTRLDSLILCLAAVRSAKSRRTRCANSAKLASAVMN